MRRVVSAIVLALILISLPQMVDQFFSVRAQEACGPRYSEGLEIHFYESPSEVFTALQAGEIDLFQWRLDYDQYQQAVSDPTLLLAAYAENGMMEFDINNNYTIADFPTVRSPTNELTFRQALAHMVDKDWIVNDVLEGFGERIDAHVTAPQMGWANETVIGENYPYPYNLTRAAELLDIYFADTDDDGTRNYPVGWPGREGGSNLDSIRFLIRSDHEHRRRSGMALADNMRILDIPVYSLVWSDDVLRPLIEEDKNFHIYTGGWSLGRYPTYLWGLFHTDNFFGGGSGYSSHAFDVNGDPNYPDLDDVLEGVRYPTNIEGFKAAVKKATGLLVEYCVNIPLWSYVSYWAYSKYLVGIVNMDGYSLENSYTFLNAYKVDDPLTPEDESQHPIRMGTVHAPQYLNILYSQWYYDFAVLDRIFDSLLSINPYDLSVDQPWIAQDWEVSTWYDPQDNQTKTMVTYYLRKDVYWHAPVTGEAVRQFTAHDVEFTIWYIYSFENRWVWTTTENVKCTHVVDDFTIEVYFDSESIWHVYDPTGPLLPKDEYLSLLCNASSATFYSDGTNCTASTSYIFTGEDVIQVINASVDGAPLVEGVDFEIFATGGPYYTHNEIHFLTDLPVGTVTVNYYTPTVDSHGYYLGGLDWTLTFYSLGPYYPTSITPGVGGSAIFNCVPSYFLETPPLGEIDWRWTWTGTTKPRSGHYQVNLFDAVKLLSSYCSHGGGVPDANWFPGADIDVVDIGHVGLYDAVTILGKYGKKWGTPPP